MEMLLFRIYRAIYLMGMDMGIILRHLEAQWLKLKVLKVTKVADKNAQIKI